jgi:hypothetical protein
MSRELLEERITITITPSLRRDVEALAAKNMSSVSGETRRALLEHLRSQGLVGQKRAHAGTPAGAVDARGAARPEDVAR